MAVIIPQVITEDKAGGAQVIDGSLKFDKNKSQRLQFTPSNSGNRRTWTISYWYKNTNFGNTGRQFQAGTSDPDFFLLGYHSLGYIQCTEWNTNWFRTGALLRDTGWYHIVLAWDSTQATNTERWRFYINGVRQNSWTDSGTDLNYPSQNAQQAVNKASVVHQLGSNTANSQYTDGHMSQVYFIDGQALDPSYFGYTDALTNTWRPKKAKITLGSVWSNYFTDIGIIDDGALTNVFDGNTATQFEFNSTGGNGVFRPPNPISYSTSIELFSSRAFGGNTVSVNGGSTVSYGGNAWVTVASGPGTLTSLTFYNGTAGNQRIHAIRIDGNILTNTSGAIDAGANGYYLPLDGNTPIGQDQSGRGNNWTPVNFGGSNTIEKATGALPILNTDGGGKVARVGVRTDSNASSLVLALPLVGITSDFSNAINSGTSNKAITANGNAAASSAQSNFYGGSFYFDGTGDFLSVPYSSDIDIGAGDFTVETWIYKNAASEMQIFDFRGNPCNTGWALYTKADGRLEVYDSVAATQLGNSNPYNVTVGAWNHVALTKSGSTVTFWVNGINGGTFTRSSLAATTSLRIGISCDGNSSINGYLQDVRIYKGLAKYTQNFIPASTDPDILPDTPSGVAYSSNVALVPSTDGAVAFDGSGDYLSLASNADFAFGSGDFTVEAFVYKDSADGDAAIFDLGSTNTSGSFAIFWNSGTLTVRIDGLGNDLSTTEAPSNKWIHIAVARSGSTLRLFVDGDLKASATRSNNITQSTPYIGDLNLFDYDFTGFISNFHVVKGTALYTSNFIPPTGPITSVANTKLLCCKSNSSATAFNVSPGTITANGNAAATNFNPFTVNINTQRGQESGYVTINPLDNASNFTLSNGNLTVQSTGSYGVSYANIAFNSGKWYWEYLNTNSSNRPGGVGIDTVGNNANASGTTGNISYYYYSYDGGGLKTIEGTQSSYGASYTSGDTISVALDLDARTISFYKNGINLGVAATGIRTGFDYKPLILDHSSIGAAEGSFNFGQKPFKFPPPAGFQPLALANTPRPTIVRPDQYVGIVTYNGNNTTNVIRGYNFKPDMVWLKARDNSGNGYDHIINDSVRGAGKNLVTNTRSGGASPGGEYQSSANTDFVSFDNGGFTLGSVNQFNGINNTNNIIAWAWKAGGSGGGNSFWKDDVGYATTTAAGLTGGTINPTGASINTKSGFSIITYTGNGTNATVPHGLGRKPSLTIIKNLDDSSSWPVFTDIIDGSMDQLYLDTTDAKSDQAGLSALSTTTFSILSGSGSGASTKRYVAYVWAEIPGFSKFGTYTGNSSTDGPVVITGFRPRWILIKPNGAGRNWAIIDTTRSSYNPVQSLLVSDESTSEPSLTSSGYATDVLSNGFKIRNTGAALNFSGQILYAAFAESPSFNLYGGQANAR